MSDAPFRITAFDPEIHDRAGFESGSEPLDEYFRKQLSQDVRRKYATCFVAVAPDGAIAGYYTLAATGIALSDIPPERAKKLPRYPHVPAARMGRLAVGLIFQGQGLGSSLLADALARCLNSGLAIHSLVVDAKDEAAKNFYVHHGFIATQIQPMTLFLPLDTAKSLLR